MNKKLYRIVFNKARGLLMAVAETAGCTGGVGSSGITTATAAIPPVPVARLRMIALAALIAAGGQIMLMPTAGAQIVANPSAPANQQPVIVNTATGIPQVNIQTPSAAGVSRNTYSQFDVQAQGAILNNSRSDVQTQIGGWVQRNPNLANGTARIILNEVNSSNPSYLRGYVEVAGDSAQVVIANPAGVSCSGCGFVNANRVTLTTGTPIMNGGSLDGYVVRHGTVSIDGAGMDSGGAAYTDIIARAVQINAGLWGQTLKVTAGANQVNADNSQATPIAGDGAAPAFGLDVAQLGGMYANHIFLVGTEAGVGMRNAGSIGAAAGEFTVTNNGQLINSGRINSVGATKIAASGVDNSGGKIQATGDVDIDVGSGAVNNTASLIAAGGMLSVTAGSVINANTGAADQGLHGQSVAIVADRIDNAGGQLIADQGMSLTGSGAIDNTGGAISSGLAMRIADRNAGTAAAKTLLITNTNGSIVSGASAAIDSAGLSGDGTVKSETDLGVKLSSDFTNTGALQSNTSLTFETSGVLINQGALKAVNSVNVTAASLDNQAAGEISAAALHLVATDVHTMTNRGLINGTDTFIDTPTFNNIGTGRVYGDHVAIGGTTLNNLAETVNGVTSAPVIAARTRLDIGEQTINNQEHGLITSQGDMAIGGSLDASHQATGQTDTLNNNSATIEAMGALDLNAKNVNNTNDHLATQEVQVSSTAMQEYQLSGSGTLYRPDQISVTTDEVAQLNTPEGWGYVFTRYDFVRTVMETQILSTDPARITAGLGMRINADSVNNDASIIQAGGALTGTIGQLTNTELPGHRTTTDVGTAYGYYDIEQKGRDAQGLNTSGYAPAASIAAISLTPTLYQQNATIAPTGTQIAALSTARLNSVVSIPNNSLFSVNTNPALHYLIQSDPNFTNYQSWLSSDYMLNKLNVDPSLTQKRLGDGYYEQKVVREQVAELTGKRFLGNYTSDEAQYQALMDAGVTYAQQWNLPVGVGLTPAQMAQLTSDIVLLVQKDVTLPSGEVTQVLVPQVYVRLQDGDINGSGALLAGNSTNLAVTGDITNSGTIAGRTTVAITAENVQNLGGRITGAAVTVQASNDINNLGGTIDAKDSLGVAAGHDLNIVSTTATSESAQGSRTNIDRVAALYVAYPNSTLVATAGHDINVNAAQIVNSGAGGTTTLTAGNNFAIGTVTESQTQAVSWNDKNYRKDASSQEVGSSIVTQGNLTIAAGQDLTIKGSGISSADGALVAQAGGNVNLTTANSTQSLEEGHESQGSSGWLSSKTTTTHDTLDQNLVTGSSLSGNTVAVSGNNIAIQAGSVSSNAGTTLTAAGSVDITAATSTQSETHSKNVTTSGVMGTGGIGFTIGSQSLDTASSGVSTSQSQNRSVVGATGGDVTIIAGKDTRVTGSDGIAGKASDGTGGNVAVTAQNITVDSGVDTTHSDQSFSVKQSGLTVAVVGTPLDTLRNLQEIRNGSGSALQKTKSTFEELGASASTAPQVALTYGSSSSSGSTTIDTASNSGSSMTAAGNLTLKASGNGTLDSAGKPVDGNITVSGSQLTAGGAATLDAAKNVNIVAAVDRASQITGSDSSSNSITSAAASLGDIGRNLSGGPNNSGVGLSAYNAGTGNGDGNTQGAISLSSGISANSVAITSHTGDINVVGSTVAAQNDVLLLAQQGKINVTAGENNQSTHEDNTSKQIGNLGSSNGGTATSVGIRTTSDTIDTSQQLQNPVRSAIASNNGNVTLNAKDDLTVQGSDLSAGQDLTLIGKNVNLDAGTDTSRKSEMQTSNQVGITASVGGIAGQLQQTVNQALAAQAAGDSKLSNLYAVKAAITAVNQAQGIMTSGETPALVKVTVALGTSNSDSRSDTQATQQQGTTVSAGGNVSITATGDGTTDANGKANNGDINAVGSQISGTNVTLDAARNLNLVASQDTISNTSSNSSGGASIGIGFALGGQQNGFTLELGANKLTADANGSSATNQNSVVTASNALVTKSGNDTNLVGAELRGNTVTSTVGGNLNIVSLQDTDNYTSKQDSSGFGASICIPPFCYGTTVQANANLDSSKTDSTYKSVNVQSGIYAGTGGYDINVSGNTGLVGGVIASVATPDKNSLTTGTLTVANVVNSASYSSDSSGVSVSANLGNSGDGAQDKNTTLPANLVNNAFSNLAGNLIAPATGDANGITKSAISPGTVTITDSAAQVTKTGMTADQTVAVLDRDTANANQNIGKIFDLQVIQRQQEIAKVTSDIAQQVAPLLYSRVGDLLVGSDTAEKVALHAIVGGLINQVLGGNFGSGAIGAGAAAFAVNLLADQIQSIPGMSEQDGKDLVQLLGLVVGKIAAQVSGGTAVDGNAAGVVAKLATEFNFLKHQQLDAFKARYSSCTTDACRTQVFAEMKALSDAQDAQLKTCTTTDACKDIATGEYNPLKQSWFGLLGVTPTDLLNFCNSGDTACTATLTYLAQHSNEALFANTFPGAVAGANAVSAAVATMAKDFQKKGLSEADSYAAAISVASSPGFAAALGSVTGSSSARIAAFIRGLQFQGSALAALGVPENKTRIPVTLSDGKIVTVVPDGFEGTTIFEVKDVVNLSNSDQFRGYFATGNAITLIVSPNTKTISQPLQDLIHKSGGSIQVFDPTSKSFTTW